MKNTLLKPDTIGAFASSLCMAHCIVTPFIFIVHTCALSGCKLTPIWWQLIDYFFLLISFIAISQSVKTTSNKLIKPLLWVNWFALFLVVINDKLEILQVPEIFRYVVAISLSVLHIYNLNYCQCKNENCCAKETDDFKKFQKNMN
jgi:hypothetical protein